MSLPNFWKYSTGIAADQTWSEASQVRLPKAGSWMVVLATVRRPSVRAPDDLHRIILRRPASRVNRCDEHDDDRADERGVIVVRVLGHQKPLGFDEAFHRDGHAPQPLDRELARHEADGGADQADDQALEQVDH